MAYTEFSTKNADYILQLGDHITGDNTCDLTGIDALVIEHGPCGDFFKKLLTEGHIQMNMPINHAKENKIPIFGTDAKLRRGYGSLYIGQRLIVSLSVLPVTLLTLYYGFSNKVMSNFAGKLISDLEYILQDKIVEARNAINAEKIEEFVVPRIRNISGKEKPRIGMIYGAGHIGLKEDLQSKKRRSFTLWNWRNLNFKKWGGFDLEELNKIYEANYNSQTGQWNIQEHKTNIFS